MKSKRQASGGVAMTNDAKLGLVVGIAVVILIAIVFFRKDLTVARAAPDANAPAQVQTVRTVAAIPPLPRTQIPTKPSSPPPP